MNIKQCILALFVFFGVSFSVYASKAYYEITAALKQGAPSSGIYYVASDLSTNLPLTTFQNAGETYTFSHLVRVNNKLRVQSIRESGSTGSTYLSDIITSVYLLTCPDGQEYDSLTNTCRDEPQCEPPEIYNPDTGRCELDDFCNSDEYLNLKVDANIACMNQYPDWYTKFIPSCTDRDNYSFDCVQLIPRPDDPTDDMDSPDSGFTGGSGGTANPAPPSFDKPEPDDVTPEDSTDTAVLSAIQNMNRDNNQAFTGLNTDINQGFADVNNQLSQLNDTNNAIGQTIVDQMNQDYQIYQGQKSLLLQQSSYIAQGSSDIVNTLGSQTDTLKNSITGLGSRIDSSLDGLGSKIDGLGEKLGELGTPCDPNNDERNCEGEHGLTHDTAKDVTNQIDAAVSGQFDEAESAILDSTNQFTDGSFVSSVQVYLDDTVNLALGAMPNIGDCTPFSMPSPFGGTIDFGCEFSVKFKSIASFLLYVYTIWTLLDILFEGVTPVPGTVPHRSRGI